MTNVPMDWRHHHHHHHGLPNLKSTLLSCLRKLFQMKNLHENSNFPIKLSFLGQKKLHLGGWNQYRDCLFEALNSEQEFSSSAQPFSIIQTGSVHK
jgi:hypothetical protein